MHVQFVFRTRFAFASLPGFCSDEHGAKDSLRLHFLNHVGDVCVGALLATTQIQIGCGRSPSMRTSLTSDSS